MLFSFRNLLDSLYDIFPATQTSWETHFTASLITQNRHCLSARTQHKKTTRVATYIKKHLARMRFTL